MVILISQKQKNIMSTKKQFNPVIGKDDNVNETNLDNHLYLKKRANVVLVHNVDCHGIGCYYVLT